MYLADGYALTSRWFRNSVRPMIRPPVPGTQCLRTAVTLKPRVAALPSVKVVTTVNIWDNQTVVLGGLISSTINTENDKVPFLGDLPLFGRLFQSQSKSTVKKNLMIFVTATIVDPAGNRGRSMAMTAIAV